MKKTMSQLDFQRECNEYNCDFSINGSMALFEYLEEIEESSDIEIEFDGVAIRCEFNEYYDIEEFHMEYDKENYPTIDVIEEYTQVIRVGENGFIIVTF